MKKINGNAWLFLLLIVSSIGIYILQVVHFGTPRDTAFYILQDLAFLPLQVAIVSIVLGKYLKTREKRERLNKINMAIGAFFSEAGNAILAELLTFSTKSAELRPDLDITEKWTGSEFARALKNIKKINLTIDFQSGDLSALKTLLSEKRSFLLGMLSNPNLLEHDTFTDMLWAVFHLTDELIARDGFSDLPNTDLHHLEADIKRSLGTLLMQWLSHMAHLRSEYPYLYSLEIRRSLLGTAGSVIIR